MGAYHLAIVDQNGTVGGRIALGGRPVSIGRHPENVISIRDDLASRYHCVIEPTDNGDWRVRDLGSRNGTRLNGERVSDAAVSPGDRIQVGTHTFEVNGGANHNGPEDSGATRAGGVAEAPARARKPKPKPSKKERPAPNAAGARAAWVESVAQIIRAVAPDADIKQPISLIDARGRTSAALNNSSEGAVAARLFLLAASYTRATDLHVEPKGETVQVRMRVDGQMLDVADIPNGVGELAVGLVKAVCHMKSAGRDAILEGHFSATIREQRIDYRASITPSVHGQKLVLRILNCADAPESLAHMGLANYMLDRVAKASQQDAGMVLACGPTGSGKTTTLYNVLREIDREHRNVVTIEDPVEYHLDRVTQIPANIDRGATFGSLLRSVLRQDPDVILLGEIRDEESARVAMQAAMTGHLVFSTVHAKDTIGAVFRLLDLGVENYLVANSLNLVLAQRLVRILCDHCKRPIAVTPGQATRMGKWLEGNHEIHFATGCARCLRTGYRGRRAIYEMLEFNNDLRDVVLSEPTIHAMRRVIEQGHFTTLVQAGWQLVARGVTALDEVDRVAGSA
ncbi:MAG: FHA domain-containing protein [Phycisphaerales bacterium]|nr:MAG: FHA domain-containing protein [Phycisphaerales bacterium]